MLTTFQLDHVQDSITSSPFESIDSELLSGVGGGEGQPRRV